MMLYMNSNSSAPVVYLLPSYPYSMSGSSALSDLSVLENKEAGNGVPSFMVTAIQCHPDQIQFIESKPGEVKRCFTSTVLLSERPTPQQLLPSTQSQMRPEVDILSRNCYEEDTFFFRGFNCQLNALLPSKAAYTLALKPPRQMDNYLSGLDNWQLEQVVCIDEDAPTVILQNQEKIRQHSAHRFGSTSLTSQSIQRGEGPAGIDSEKLAASATLISTQTAFSSEEYISESLKLLDLVESRYKPDVEVGEVNTSLFNNAPGLSVQDCTLQSNSDTFNSHCEVKKALDIVSEDLIGKQSAIFKYFQRHCDFFPQCDTLVAQPEAVNEHPQDAIEPSNIASDLMHGDWLLNESTEHQPNRHALDIKPVADAKVTESKISKLVSESAEDRLYYQQLLESASIPDEIKIEELPIQDLHKIPQPESKHVPVPVFSVKDSEEHVLENLLLEIDHEILTKPVLVRENSSLKCSQGASWADVTSLDLGEYELLRPRMAMKFPFELDFFQKQAVMRLERRQCVFVAAHTSAGKTVVAEYAISMAKKHLTRAIYTSPIKALSNQKYRDFKEKFDDVGLITGDVSVNPDASCLIMTTEILRSMLYRGADAIKDIEWVIFDEVHYVNDLERGVVWEEVIIMLPDRINLIFLSATTPNTIEFSDWIGRTKRRKVFVISTSYRPVPLQHFLLHNDEIYPILGTDGKYNSNVVSEVVKHEKEKAKPKEKRPENVAMSNQRQMEKAAIAAQNRGGAPSKNAASFQKGPQKPAGSSNSGQAATAVAGGRTQWISLLKVLQSGGREASMGSGLNRIDFGTGYSVDVLAKKERKESMVPYDRLPLEMRNSMSKKEYEKTEFLATDGSSSLPNATNSGCLLPVVVFCFSKKKCEEIIDYFKGQDLLNANEKFMVRSVKQNVLGRLNPADSKLPQVIYIFDMLDRGFGVHHGGLLPILKESVEVLFAQSIVKFLIATETFAMGVNMPARSVVFNGTRKHDGRGFRDLLPGEYTQMAGRAGRRGLDKVGTVVIAAWTELPTEIGLRTLITGTARKLVSQFRLSYNMILNLLRTNDLNVEDMIKRSFSEFTMQRALSTKDLHAASMKYEHFYSLLCKKIEEEPQCYQENASTNPVIYEDLLSCLKICSDATQSFLKASVNCFCESDLVGTVPLTSLHSILSTGRIIMLQRNDGGEDALGSKVGPCFGLVLTNPVYVSKTASAESRQTISTGKSISDIRRSLMASSVADTIATKTKIVDAEEICSDTFVTVLIITPPTYLLLNTCSMSQQDMELKSDPELEIEDYSRQHVRGTISLNGRAAVYQKIEIKLSDVCAITGTVLNVVGELSSDIVGLHNYVFGTSVDSEIEYLNLQKALKRSDVDAAVEQNKLDSAAPALLKSRQLFYENHTQKMCFLLQKADSLKQKINGIKQLMSHEKLSLFPDFQQRLAVLKELRYVEGDSGAEVVTLKGRVACEMNTCDELLATEAIFGNLLEPLNPPEAVAMLSAFVFQEKSNEERQLTSRMEIAKKQLKMIGKKLQTLQELYGVEVFENNRGNDDKGTKKNDVLSSLNFGLCAVVYEWARGTSFKDIATMTEVHEGSVVRCITRVDELCRDVRNAARALGNPSLYRKMEAASQCIKRDIVFAASLYVS